MFDPRESLSVTQDGDRLFAKAQQDGVETVWERHEAQQPQCGFCDMGLSCRICIMGPCRVDPFGEGPQTGVCGADADIIVARNLCRMIAAGAASHSDHGRDLVEVLAGVADGSAIGYKIRDEAKLRRLAEEYGIAIQGKKPLVIAGELAQAMMEDYGMRQKAVKMVARAPKKRQAVWEKFGLTPRGIDRETSEMMHRTHMGVDNNWQSLLLQAMRNCPVRRLGRLHDRHRSLRHPLRCAHPAAHHGQRRRVEGGPGQHRGSRAQPGGVGNGLQGLPSPRISSIWPRPRVPGESTWWGSAARATNCSCAGASPWRATT